MLQYHIIQYYNYVEYRTILYDRMRIHKEKHIHFSILHPSSDRDSNVSQRAVNGRGLLQNVMSKRIELLYL